MHRSVPTQTHVYNLYMKSTTDVAVRMLQYCFLFDAIIFCSPLTRCIRVTSSFSFTYHCGIFCSGDKKKWKKKLERWSINLHCALRHFFSAEILDYIHKANARRDGFNAISIPLHDATTTSSSTIILLLLLVIE